MKSQLLTFLVAVGLVSCATPTPEPVSGAPIADVSRSMVGLADPAQTEFWNDWTPRAVSSGERVVFDYWILDDPQHVERLWAAVSTVLDALRHSSDRKETWDAVSMVLSTVEPTTSAGRVAVAFSIHPKPLDEGIAFEFVGKSRELKPRVRIELVRGADQGTPILSIVVDSGAMEGPIQTLVWTQDQTWSATLNGEPSSMEGPIADLLLALFWTPYTGSSYVDEDVRRQSEYLGPLEFRDRGVFEVLTDSAFPPWMDISKFPINPEKKVR